MSDDGSAWLTGADTSPAAATAATMVAAIPVRNLRGIRKVTGRPSKSVGMNEFLSKGERASESAVLSHRHIAERNQATCLAHEQ
ncbi:hypothetical protein GCM10009720_04580 [Yaniella flava]|uniref:Uncharacterized protein n=1 Tax=Yaniella flava TaxID=287930 RepID=A0ABN2U3E4_9MICC